MPRIPPLIRSRGANGCPEPCADEMSHSTAASDSARDRPAPEPSTSPPDRPPHRLHAKPRRAAPHEAPATPRPVSGSRSTVAPAPRLPTPSPPRRRRLRSHSRPPPISRLATWMSPGSGSWPSRATRAHRELGDPFRSVGSTTPAAVRAPARASDAAAPTTNAAAVPSTATATSLVPAPTARSSRDAPGAYRARPLSLRPTQPSRGILLHCSLPFPPRRSNAAPLRASAVRRTAETKRETPSRTALPPELRVDPVCNNVQMTPPSEPKIIRGHCPNCGSGRKALRTLSTRRPFSRRI